MSTQTPKIVQQKKFTKIPIFIAENHNEVLEIIYRSLGSRHLKFQNNYLVHFDSHPDLTIPRTMPAEFVFDKDKLLDELSIENWIMPMCYGGHVDHVLWIKPEWAQQFTDGDYEFLIGDSYGRIRTNSPEGYFLSEGTYAPDTEMINRKLMKLFVRTLDHTVSDVSSDDENFETIFQPINSENFILDIDLDFFSTLNPFRELYPEVTLFDMLRPLFDYDWVKSTSKPSEIWDISKTRESQLDDLELIFNELNKNRHLDDFKWTRKTECYREKMFDLIKLLTDQYDDNDIDWLLVYNAGCTIDKIELPHHKSTSSEINKLLEMFETFLGKIQIHNPILVTISRSTDDDYCPSDQVDMIQAEVLQRLRRVYGEKLTDEPILRYQHDEWTLPK